MDVHLEIKKALLEEESGDLQGALQRLKRLSDQHPEVGEIWLEHALLLDKHDLEKEAIPHYQNALACGLNPGRVLIALICLASSYRNVGEIQKGLETIETARQQFPDHAVIECFYSLILHSAGEHAKALSTLGFTLLREARFGAVAGFEEALRYKFNELLS
jgi:tetratricopeptide (TPR) repeat protein